MKSFTNLLSCPICKSDIKILENNYYCSNQNCEHFKVQFPNFNNVPALVDGDKILFIGLSNYMDYGGFSFDEVREVILRLVDYLGDRYKGCSVLSVGEYERSNINKREIVEHNWFGNLTNLVIIYK